MTVFLVMVLLVASLATMVASILAGNAPAPWITGLVAGVVVGGLIVGARWLWRNARAVGVLIDAADRVTAGELETRAAQRGGGALGRLTDSFNLMAERLETDERRRRELLADIAHELRTPLQVIKGTVEGMLHGVYPSDPERLRPIVDQTETMARLLDDLRTLSMAEAGMLRLHRESVDPRAVVDDVLDAFRSMAQDGDVRVRSAIGEVAPATIEVDPVRLSEVLTNLVANAVRHTPRGGTVTVRIVEVADWVRFEVEDTGDGIPEAERSAVFDRFVTSADTGGTGLGLAIAKRLVEAHGGSIEAVEAPGGGTIVRFVLPR